MRKNLTKFFLNKHVMEKKDSFFNFRCTAIANELSKSKPEKWICAEIYTEVVDVFLTQKEHTKRREKWPVPRYFMSPEYAMLVFNRLSEIRDEKTALKFIALYFEEFVVNHKTFLEYFGPETYKGVSLPYYNEVQKIREPLFIIITKLIETNIVNSEILSAGLKLFRDIINEGAKSIHKYKKQAKTQKVIDKCDRSLNTIQANLQTIADLEKQLV